MTDKGDLDIVDQFPNEMIRDSDNECILKIESPNINRVLLALLEKLYK